MRFAKQPSRYGSVEACRQRDIVEPGNLRWEAAHDRSVDGFRSEDQLDTHARNIVRIEHQLDEQRTIATR